MIIMDVDNHDFHDQDHDDLMIRIKKSSLKFKWDPAELNWDPSQFTIVDESVKITVLVILQDPVQFLTSLVWS